MPTRLGFLGFGIMGERLLRAALTHNRAQIVVSGIFDPSLSAAQRLTAIDPSLKAFATADAVISESDCLHIAAPPKVHLEYLDRCAAAGRAALCEKPLATDVVAATAMVGSLRTRGARAAVNFPFVSSPAVDHLQRWMAEGAVGKPERIDIDLAFANWPRSWQMDAAQWLDGRAEGGFTREVASHFLFLTQRLIGELKLHDSTCSYAENGSSERAIAAQLTAASLPVSLSGAVGTTDSDDHNIWMLTGTAGRIRLRNWSIAERETTEGWQAPADAMINEKARPLVLQRQLDKIDDMTRGKQTNLATLDEALEVQTIVETILSTKKSQ